MICGNCGTENPAGRRFCDNCGSALAAACPTCGEQNRPDARFCGNCGTPLAPGSGSSLPAAAGSHPPEPGADVPPRAAERRLVSVLFADIVGFTPFAEERDPEEVRDTLSRYFDAARTVIERHGGMVEKFIGDAVMAVWGTPVAHEDDAERAVRAALELATVVKGVDPKLDARVGVVTGEAAVTPGASAQAIVAGDLVNTAARLQAVAPPGAVLVGEPTMRAASAAIAFEPAGERELKGKSVPVPAWRALRVTGDRRGRSRSDVLEPPFVGREAELSLLKELLHAAGRERRSRLIVVTGPAGIGKSRLAWELEKYLDGLVENVYWHRGRSPSYGEGISFWALGEMVRRRAHLAETDDEATTRQRIAEMVAEYVLGPDDQALVEPALLALLGVGSPPPGGREVLFAAWRIFFERIAARGTTVLLFEDLQWADSGLLDFIDHLLEWSKAVPIVVLVLARPELSERRPDFGSVTRHFHSIPLEPLAGEHMRALLDGLVPGLADDAVRAIVDRADGIPLYAVETVRMLLSDGRLEPVGDGTFRPVGTFGQLAIPETLRSLVASRLDALSTDDRDLLQHASVLGQTFSLDSLAAVTGLGRDQLAGRLRTMVRREILALEADPRSPERGQYSFVQGLIREVAYGTLALRERRDRHLAAARYYESKGDEEVAGALAGHYVAAYVASTPGPEADAVAAQARIALRAAAERASALGSHAQALSYLERALLVTQEGVERAALLELAARAADAAAHFDRGVELARQASDAYAALHDPIGVARTSGLLGTLLIDSAQLSQAITELNAALHAVPDEAVELRAELSARLARAYMRTRDLEAAIAAADEALVLAERHRLRRVIADAMINKGSALAGAGRTVEGCALIEAAARVAEEAGEMAEHLRALNNLAVSLDDEDPGRAATIVEDALELATRLGLRGYSHWLTGSHAFNGWWRGQDWDAVLTFLADARESVATTRHGDTATVMPELLIRASRGEFPPGALEYLQTLARETDDPTTRAPAIGLQGMFAFGAGELEQAYDLYVKATEALAEDIPAVEWGIRVALWLADLRRAATIVARLDALPFSGRSALALRTWAHAGIAALEGREAEAKRGLLEAIAERRAMGMEFWAACFALDALILLPGDGDMRKNAEFAREVFERVGAMPYLRRLDEALRQVSSASREPIPTAATEAASA